MAKPTDWQARQQAIDPTGSFAVTAPAGSGKTGLLTQRVLTLLPRCQNPEEILCITFTRKAAAEMQERISEAIHQAATEPRPSDSYGAELWDLAQKVVQHNNSQGWNLLENPQRLRIQTIDGLCRNLSVLNPLESQTSGSASLLEMPTEAYELAVDKLFRYLGESHPVQQDLAKLLHHLDNNLDQLKNLLTGLLARRSQWLSYLMQAREARAALEQSLQSVIEASLDEACELLSPYQGDLTLLMDFAGSNCLEDNPDSEFTALAGCIGLPDTALDCVADWQKIANFLTTGSNTFRSIKGLNKKYGFPAASDKLRGEKSTHYKQLFSEITGRLNETNGGLSAINQLKILPNPHYSDQQWYILDSLTRVLPILVGELKLVFRQLNAVDFTEINLAALNALGDEDSPTDTNLMLDYQIQHILVDEFQDTSTPQLMLLERLTAGWQPGDGRTLFIVGDGMQSCYGFRDANVGIFLEARDRGIGSVKLTPLQLTNNFRSSSTVVEWVNEAFMRAFPEIDDIGRGAVKYSPAVPFHSAFKDSNCITHLIVNEEEDRHSESQKVAELVKNTLTEKPEGNIAILVRNRSHLREIIPALKAENLDWQASDIEPLQSRVEIIDLVTLTRVITDINNRHAWVALLRSRWCGLDNSDLLKIAGKKAINDEDGTDYLDYIPIYEQLQDPSVIKGLSREGQFCLSRMLSQLLPVWANRSRKRLRDSVEGLWLALGGPATLDTPEDIANVHDFFEVISSCEHGGTIEKWSEFELALSKLYARPSEAADSRVQIMTIHKSKGLEFDTVIIPGLDKSTLGNDRELFLWLERINRDHQAELLLASLEAKGDAPDPAYEYIRSEHKLRDRYEATRLLYVGCTRAISTLHLLACVRPDKKEPYRAPGAQSLLAPIWTFIKDQAIEVQSHSIAADNEDSLPKHTGLWRLPPDWQAPALIPETLMTRFRGRETDDEDNLPDLNQIRNRDARHIGTLIHELLQTICEESAFAWKDKALSSAPTQWHWRLRQLGMTEGAAKIGAERALRSIQQILNDERGLWILDNQHEDSRCEYELWTSTTGKTAQEPKLSIVDRTFVDDGYRWVIDYKSSQPDETESLEVFLEREVETYRQQLQRYRHVFEQIESNPIKTALYFPMIQVFQIID